MPSNPDRIVENRFVAVARQLRSQRFGAILGLCHVFES
jgi:hypothetical protein